MQPSPRFPQLDALRGVAAFWVFCHHAFMMMPVTPLWLERIQYTPLNFFCDGIGAVILFFVLSGLVLNLKYVSLPTLPPRWVAAFIVNRIFRIYPAFFVAIFLSLLLRFVLYDPTVMGAMSADLNSHWRDPLNLPDFLKLFTLVIPGIHPDQIDPPMWTLVLEMRISLLFPLVIFCLCRPWKTTNDLVFLVATYLVCFPVNGETVRFVPFFVLGAVCAKHFDRLRSLLGGFNPLAQVLWLAASLCLFETVSMVARYPLSGRYCGYLSQGLLDWVRRESSWAVFLSPGLRRCLPCHCFNSWAKLPTVFIWFICCSN